MGTRGEAMVPFHEHWSKIEKFSVETASHGSEEQFLKRAILVAMADEYPFREIHEKLHLELEKIYREYGFDVFYVYAKKSSKMERKIRRRIEEIRWGKFHLLLRIYDLISLSRFRFSIPKYTLEGKYIRVDVPEDLRHLSVKILSSLEVLNNLGYDLVIRTTASSIFNPHMISIESSRIKDFVGIYYGGREIRQADGFNFISGSFTIWNREAINFLLNSREKLDYSLIDDVCFGRLFQQNAVTTENQPSINIGDISDFPAREQVNKTLHFRCRTGITQRDDLPVMQHLLRLIKENLPAL